MAKTAADHRARHVKLHRMLDELAADWITETGRVPSQATVLDLMKWSNKQTTEPDDRNGRFTP